VNYPVETLLGLGIVAFLVWGAHKLTALHWEHEANQAYDVGFQLGRAQGKKEWKDLINGD
jgi:hypothetical protein